MSNFLNRFFGGLTRLLILSPFLVLGMIFIPFLFIDRLLQGRFIEAFWELTRVPLKLLLILLFAVQLFVDGWTLGFVPLMSTLPQRFIHFFKSEIFTNPNFFFAALGGGTRVLINHLEGPFFGALLRKIVSLTFPLERFISYEAHDDSPHNELHTQERNTVYALLKRKYGHFLEGNIQLYDQIEHFLNEQLVNSSDEERASAQAAQRCLLRVKREADEGSRGAIDLDDAPKPLNVLFLVWIAIEQESDPAQAYLLQKVLASYLTQIQRGYNRMINPEDEDCSAEDYPECASGAVGLILDVLKSIPGSDYKVAPSRLENVERMQQLLTTKLQNDYNVTIHMAYFPHPNPEQELQQFKREQTRGINYYAHFLQSTPQGQKLFGGNLNAEDLDATVEASLEDWRPHQLR